MLQTKLINQRPVALNSLSRVHPCLPRVRGVTPSWRKDVNSQGFTARAANVVYTEEEPTSVAHAVPEQPAHGPGSPETLPMGVQVYPNGQVSVRLWAPHVKAVKVQVGTFQPASSSTVAAVDAAEVPAVDAEPTPKAPSILPSLDLQLQRCDDTWWGTFTTDILSHGTPYQFVLSADSGQELERRDPYGRQADYDSAWCIVDDASQYQWQNEDWQLPSFDKYIIYEMHVGSWTPEGTFASAAAKLEHLKKLGFTAVQVMPISEHSDLWGYSPRHPMAIHSPYGTPDDFRAFVDHAHGLGLAVIVDVVLHHGAPNGNVLWDYDGWSDFFNGGIYHERAPDTPWGRAWAFWKGEVIEMLASVCSMWLGCYRCDGLRFDSANDLPWDFIKTVTWRLKTQFPGRILTAEVTPENPAAVHELGFDSLWVHSGYFDIIQQHKALGRGHHGGGDWAEGWNLPRLRTAMAVHPGFTSPTQCVKYILGSHDQCGDQHGGGWTKDYEMIGGQHRYAVDQFGGGRTDPHATACSRLWWSAGVAAAGLPMMFMGTEWCQPGWFHIDEHRRPNWDYSRDEIGLNMMACVTDTHALRTEFPALRYGWANIMHEDRPNGVMAFERVSEGKEKIFVVVNCGRAHWQAGEYGVWTGGGAFEEIFSSQSPKYGGWEGWLTNSGRTLQSYDGKMFLNVPPQCTLMFKSVLA